MSTFLGCKLLWLWYLKGSWKPGDWLHAVTLPDGVCFSRECGESLVFAEVRLDAVWEGPERQSSSAWFLSLCFQGRGPPEVGTWLLRPSAATAPLPVR